MYDFKEDKCNVNPDRLAERSDKSAGQDICAYFGHYLFIMMYFRFFHVRCLNSLEFVHRLNFWDRKKIVGIWTDVLFSRSILTIFDRPFYIARDRTPVSACMIPNV